MHRSFRFRRFAGSLATPALFAASLAASPSAQTQDPFHVSLTSTVSVGGVTFDDGDLVTAGHPGASRAPHPFFTGGHWQGVAGFVPSDIDAFGRRPNARRGRYDSMAFSLLSNEGGFEDGDVLTFGPGGGVEVLVPESELMAGLGTSVGIDVDALDFDLQGCMYFSLQADLANSIFGVVEDGDVMSYDRLNGVMTMVYREADIQTMFTLATGSTAAIGDVQALEVVGTVLWVVTQGPSSHDGAILACDAVPYIVVDEAAMGLGGAEIDALSLAEPPEDLPTFRIEPASAAPGDTVTITLEGDPSTPYLAVLAGTTGFLAARPTVGFGAWYVDPTDPWLNALLSGPGLPIAVTDGAGTFSRSWTLPTAPVHGPGFAAEEGWSFQVLDLATGGASAPFRVVKL